MPPVIGQGKGSLMEALWPERMVVEIAIKTKLHYGLRQEERWGERWLIGSWQEGLWAGALRLTGWPP